MQSDERFRAWLDDLETRHLADLRFAEVTRALRALSTTYVQRRGRLATRGSLDSAGKRAAFALFYGPLHYLLVRHVVSALPGAFRPFTGLLDLGCGTGAAGAAWAAATTPRSAVTGVDVHPWAVSEAATTYRAFGLAADVRRGQADRAPVPGESRAPRTTDGVLAAYVVNELTAEARDALLPRLLAGGAAGARILVVEPIATSVSPWWPTWQAAFSAAGGRADEWRIPVELPPLVARLDRAAGLRHDVLTARTLWLDGPARR
ncbi:MAG: methyltransferase domain-containing protein [Vicinamibacterales bacterium]